MIMTRARMALAAVFLFPSFACAQYGYLEVPFVPTPHNVVAEMLKIAEVGEGDILYDLGCGDGRIVISAVKEYGIVKGVGVDKDPRRIRDSVMGAELAQVTDRASFLEQDLFDTDIREATVVSMYLLPSVNITLRPKLLRELKPGSRLVSHNYDMREWEPDKYKTLGGHGIYLWIIPANVNGVWELNSPNNKDGRKHILHLKQRYQEIEGEITIGSERFPITEAVLTGDRIQFAFRVENGGQIHAGRFIGQVNGNTIEGTADDGKKKDIPWKALRDPATVTDFFDSEE